MPLSTLIILPLSIITLVLASFFKRKKWQLPLIIIMTVLIVMELVSIYFSGGFIDYQFYVNLNINDVIEGLFIFKFQAFLVVMVFSGFIYLFYKLSIRLRQFLPILWRIGLAFIALASLCYPNGPISRFYEIFQVTLAPRIDFDQSLNKLGMHNYPTKSQITSLAGKNIIVISLESFEQGFLDFGGLTPHLKQLSQIYTFFPNMPMSLGSTWTTASMYTYMTGMPFLIGGKEIPPLVNTDKLKLVSLGDVLHQAGYQTRYIIGNPSFAGIGHIIHLLGIDVVSEESYPDQYHDTPFGLYDKDVFDIAKKQLSDMHKVNKPFALFISTISTHAPNGFKDNRMESVISPKDDNMSFVAASLDYNLGQFIAEIEHQGLLDNTVFYIFPDHLMMGTGTPTISHLSQKERRLYLLTNASEKTLQKTTDQTIYQIDLPRLILNGADVKTNAKFLTDYLPTTPFDKKRFIEKNKTHIATINHSAKQ